MGEYAREMTEEETRAYTRGYEETAARLKAAAAAPMPAASWSPEPEPYLQPEQFRGLPKPGTDRGRWFRSTPAGQLRAVTEPDAPDEAADEARRAKAWIEDYEYRYPEGRRPSMTQARFAVGRRSDGVTLTGDVRDLAAVFRQAGIRYSVIDTSEPLPADPVNVITERVTRA